MATAKSASFLANSNDVWEAVIDIVISAGYTVLETDAAAKKIRYSAKVNSLTTVAQIVQVSVVGAADKALVSLNVNSTQFYLLEGPLQKKLVQYVMSELGKRFTLAAQKSDSNAPGTGSGCMGMVLLLVGAALGVAIVAGRL